MKSKRLNRRGLLAALGAGGAATLFPSLFADHGFSARAEIATTPRRIVFVGTAHGTVYDQFRLQPLGMSDEVARFSNWQMPLTGRKAATMKPGGLDSAGQPWPSAWDVESVGEFSRILAPLSPFAAKMLILDGLSLLPCINDPQVVSDAHIKGGICRWTGNRVREANAGVYTAFGPSLDQNIAAVVARPDRIPSLELGTTPNDAWLSRFDAEGNPLPTEKSPMALYSRLFQTGNVPANDPLELAQSSILDFVQNEYKLLAPKLSGADRQKLETHRDLVRDLEKRLAGLAQAECAAPPVPAEPLKGLPQEMRIRYEAFMPLITMALACDLTRVVTLLLPGAEKPDFDGPAGDLHADFAHHAEDFPPDDIAHEMMTRYHTTNMTLVTKLCAFLDSVPEGDGTLLDHTIVAWFADVATGSHDFHNYPVILLGGGKFLATGRYLHYAQNLTPYGSWEGILRTAGMPHNKLLTTLGRVFGLASNSTGMEVVSAVGHDIDCTGTLDEILL